MGQKGSAQATDHGGECQQQTDAEVSSAAPPLPLARLYCLYGDQRDGVKNELIRLLDNIQSIVAVSLFFASSEGSVGLN